MIYNCTQGEMTGGCEPQPWEMRGRGTAKPWRVCMGPNMIHEACVSE